MSRVGSLPGLTIKRNFSLFSLSLTLNVILACLSIAEAQSPPSLAIPESSLTAELVDPALNELVSADQARRDLARLLGESATTRREAISLNQNLILEHPTDHNLSLALAELLVQEA